MKRVPGEDVSPLIGSGREVDCVLERTEKIVAGQVEEQHTRRHCIREDGQRRSSRPQGTVG